MKKSRRDVLSLLGASGVGVVFASALPGCENQFSAQVSTGGAGSAAAAPPKPANDFFFLQLSDSHWGYKGPANPEASESLKKIVKLINSSTRQPDFIMFTGDLTHTTDDPALRRSRLAEFKAIVSDLKCKNLLFIPGEHDGSLDASQAYKEYFGDTHWTLNYKGIHFIALDNVSDIDMGLGEAQLKWLEADLASVHPDTPVVVFTHRPLFDMQVQWEWWTRDGAKAIDILSKHKNVTVFYGHIHQEHHHMTGHIAHHSARSMIFALPQAGSVPKRQPLPWKADEADHHIGFRQVVVNDPQSELQLTDFTQAGARLPHWVITPPAVPKGPVEAPPANAPKVENENVAGKPRVTG